LSGCAVWEGGLLTLRSPAAARPWIPEAQAPVRHLLRSGAMQRHSTSDADRKLLGLDGGLRSLGAVLDSVAATSSTVLLLGETGTGKELLAREIHARSPRCNRAFVAVNCAAFCDGLLESELFGHESGAFTGAHRTRLGRFEMADGGTILLDEVGEMPIRAQVALLRFLQEREFERVGSSQTRTVDVRVIAATNVRLEARIRQGAFREDLFYRLNVVPLFLPPLRERKEDIPTLARAFVEELGLLFGKRVTLSDEALATLETHSWPGNARELRNVLERAVVMAEAEALLSPAALVGLGPPANDGRPALSVVEEIRAVTEEEAARAIRDALYSVHGNKAAAARRLGIPRTTLHDSMRRLKLG
jgi:formate hydrogenlyase transcriptional activator